MDAVGTDNEVEPACCRLVEDHINAIVIRMQRGDHLVEEKLRFLTTGVDQDRAEV